VKTGTRSYFIPATEIDWIEGADYCAKIHAAGRGHLVRESLTSLAARLDSAMFCRVHRSAIVNVNRVREIQMSSSHEATAVLSSGAKIRIARGRRAALEAMIEGAG
jgi:two-component system LytT family response regulator